MKAHAWRLTRTRLAPVSRRGATEYTWHCDNCGAEVETKGPSHVGAEGAKHYQPGMKALQANVVLEDCDEALVTSVHNL